MELDVKGKDGTISCLDILISTGFHEIISNFTMSRFELEQLSGSSNRIFYFLENQKQQNPPLK